MQAGGWKEKTGDFVGGLIPIFGKDRPHKAILWHAAETHRCLLRGARSWDNG
jgi:hypothetical protein